MGRTTRIITVVALLVTSIGVGDVAAGPSGGALPPQLIRRLEIAGNHGIPNDAVMVAANITALNAADNGFLTVFPCDEELSDTSNVNYFTDQIAPNLVLARLSADGAICIATLAVADVFVDLVGYVPADSTITPLPTPERIFDSRTTNAEPIPAGTTTPIPIDTTGVPNDATLALFNATAIAADQPGYLTFFPCGTDIPDTSSVNYLPSQIVPNFTASRIGTDQTVCVYNLAPAHIIVDLAATATDGITPLDNPVRIRDTRDDLAPPVAGSTLTIDVTSHPDVPDIATSAIYNLTSVGSEAPGFATSYPCDEPQPDASNLNYAPGQIVANGAITKLSPTGQLCIYTLATTHLIIDLVGYTQNTTSYTPTTPTRIWDTRQGWQRTCDWLVLREPAGTNLDHIRVLNAVTGEVRQLELGFQPPSQAIGVSIDASCTNVLAFFHQISPSVAGLYELGLDGGRTRHPTPEAVEFSFLIGVHSVDDRALVASEGGALYDAVTGEEFWEGPRPSDPIETMDVSPSGIAVVTFRNFETGELSTNFEVWDASTGAQISDAVLPTGGANVSISPDGTYVAVQVFANTNTGLPPQILVVTLFGSIVDGFAVPITVMPLFAGNGSILLCADFNGTYEWNLFGELRKLLDWPTVMSVTGGDNCAVTR